MNFKFRSYNKKNWYTGVVHACNPKWREWSDVPENLQNLHAPQSEFYSTPCGADKNASTFNLTSKHKVTCMRCLEIMGEQFDKDQISRQEFTIWKFKSNDGFLDFAGKNKRCEILK